VSKLLNAPLLEVIFELRWKVTSKEDLAKCQYLHGDLFAVIKEDFKYREALVAPEVPMELYQNFPAHRFRVAQNDYPLVQVGPGLLTLNTIDPKYIWEDFELLIQKTIQNFLKVYKFELKDEITLALQYLDFFEFNFETNDVYAFLSNNLNTSVKQDFYNNQSHPDNLNLVFQYNTNLGSLTISIARGRNIQKKDGIVIRTAVYSKSLVPNIKLIHDWLSKSHEFCSQLFKDMTKGELYKSFSIKK
jgi:uncharacterized protein (TIGR04255 family)